MKKPLSDPASADRTAALLSFAGPSSIIGGGGQIFYAHALCVATNNAESPIRSKRIFATPKNLLLRRISFVERRDIFENARRVENPSIKEPVGAQSQRSAARSDGERR